MLKKLAAPRALFAGVESMWWPGDPAIDLEMSDVAAWCNSGGKTGLVKRQGQEVSEIVWLPLDGPAYDVVVSITSKGIINACYEAFRYGVVSIEGLGLVRERDDRGIIGIKDSNMQALYAEKMPLPSTLLDSLVMEITGQDMKKWMPDDLQEVFDMEVSLPLGIGRHILIESFRKRKAT